MGTSGSGPILSQHLDGPPSPTATRPRRRVLRRILVAAWIAGSIAILATVLTVIAVARVAGHLQDARSSMQRGRTALSFGDLQGASAAFRDAQASFADARGATHGALFDAVSVLPVLGRNADAARDMVDAGARLAAAGTQIVDAVTPLPDGLGSLAPHGGRIPVENLAAMRPVVADARAQAEAALSIVRGSPSSLLLGPVASARSAAEGQVSSAADALSSADLLLEGLPDFAGKGGVRRYFFGAENPAELRGTSGIIGAYAIVTIRDGELSFSSFRPIQTLRNLPPDAVPPPNPDFRANYDRYGGAGFWQNINMTPDFPSAARAIESTYARVEHTRLDGVIAADPFALQALLQVTGPAIVPGLGVQITADNVVTFTTNSAYRRFDDPAKRKRVLGAVAENVFDRFLGQTERGAARLRTIAHAFAGGHIQVYSNNEPFEQGLERAGVAGSLSAPQGDVVAVVVNNASGSKVDFYGQRTVDVRVQLEPGGSSNSTTDVRIHNGAPTTGVPRYVIGPAQGTTYHAGEAVPIVSVFRAPGTTLASAARNGEVIGLHPGTELALPFFQDTSSIDAGKTMDLRVSTQLAKSWTGSTSGGSYTITFLNQTTIKPTTVRIEIVAPPGMGIGSTSVPMHVEGETAVWEGTPERALTLTVTFRPPFLTRMWRNTVRAL